jgi:hypothetical protein
MVHTRESVLERVRREFALLDATVSQLTLADWNRPVSRAESQDPWTLKDTLAHITYWKADSARRFRGQRRKRGEAPLPKSVNEFNHVIYEEWKERPLEAVLEWHRETQDELLAALEDAPDDLFSKRRRARSWPRASTGHSAEHRVKDFERAAR